MFTGIKNLVNKWHYKLEKLWGWIHSVHGIFFHKWTENSILREQKDPCISTDLLPQEELSRRETESWI